MIVNLLKKELEESELELEEVEIQDKSIQDIKADPHLSAEFYVKSFISFNKVFSKSSEEMIKNFLKRHWKIFSEVKNKRNFNKGFGESMDKYALEIYMRKVEREVDEFIDIFMEVKEE